MTKNKKAEKLLSIWWFFVLAIIAGGIVIGVLIYSSSDVDINEAEARVLSERISNCLVDNGHLKLGVFESDFDIFDFCNLNQEVFEENTNFYFNISVYDSKSLIFNLFKGSSSFEKDCRIGMTKDVEAEYFPGCSEKQEGVLFNGEIVRINVLTASNQNGRKISV
ncbi:MAG: hypothetical protein WCX73_05150 [Candidatus Pacearchaeota archaeon]